MSFLQRSDVRRYWWLILLLLLVLIYWVYLLIGQLHPPPFPCPPCTQCQADSNFLFPDGTCILASNIIASSCNPVQPTDPNRPNDGGVVCFFACPFGDFCKVPQYFGCAYNSPFSSPLPNTTTLFFNGTYFEVAEPVATVPAGCVNDEIGCFNYVSAISCQDS